MLKIQPTNDKKLLSSLSQQLFGSDFHRGVGYVLYFNEQAVGVASLSISEEQAVLERVGIIKEMRSKGLGDFLTRSLLNTLSYTAPKIIIDYKDDYFIKFGFTMRERDMIIQSQDLIFPSACTHNSRSD